MYEQKSVIDETVKISEQVKRKNKINNDEKNKQNKTTRRSKRMIGKLLTWQ